MTDAPRPRAALHGRQHAGTAVFLLIIVAVVLIVGGHNFERYFIAKQYPVQAFTSCDVHSHNCFVADPATADPTFQAAPYAKVELDAAEAPPCLDEHTCTDFSCTGRAGCTLTYCSASTKETGESCSDEHS